MEADYSPRPSAIRELLVGLRGQERASDAIQWGGFAEEISTRSRRTPGELSEINSMRFSQRRLWPSRLDLLVGHASHLHFLADAKPAKWLAKANKMACLGVGG